MKTFKFGETASGLPIIAHRFGGGAPKTLVLGGVHGNEPEGVVCALGLINRFSQAFTLKMDLVVVPYFNLEGVLSQERRNSRGVDLNRNLPTKDWTPHVAEPKYNPGPAANSEPENIALTQFIEQERPAFIISLHSWKPCVNVNGNCRPEAEVIRAITGYEITEDIGYPTPGCLGTYTGHEREIPTITYEIERGLDKASVLKIHVNAVHEALKSVEKRFS